MKYRLLALRALLGGAASCLAIVSSATLFVSSCASGETEIKEKAIATDASLGDVGNGDGALLSDGNGQDIQTTVVDSDGDGHCAPGTVDPRCLSDKDCDDNDDKRHPGAVETCADIGIDNDCDGDDQEVDADGDEKDDRGETCSTSLPGICQAGKTGCEANQLSCLSDYRLGQISETCNGEDDDCNGKTDDGQLCSNGNSCQGLSGCQCNGQAACIGSTSCCPSGCADTETSTENCGGCGVGCGASETCGAGKCECGTTIGSVGGGTACPTGTHCDGTSCVLDCTTKGNQATTALAASSGGGFGDKGPSAMIDGALQSSCGFHWITATSTPADSWIELSWSNAVRINQIEIDTAPEAGACSMSSGRTLAGGTLQYHDGSKWVAIDTISNKLDDWTAAFPTLETRRLRIYGAHASNKGHFDSNPMIFEWKVYCR
ncbi:MAG: hypothetical protein H6707_04525 [Deltaproteobacteria bacterium]|nr:hypothetical protein [Deltaproteobacteria bacterium]